MKNPNPKNQKVKKKPNNFKNFESLKVDYRPKALSRDKFLPPILSMTSNHFHHPIYYKTAASMLKQFSPSTTTKKEKMEEDVESLKQELSMHRSAINRKKSELNELRILINKLSEDNKNNKLLIAKILNIEMDKSFTKRELINTILNCKPTDAQKKELMEAYEVINLKLKINDKKKILNENNSEITHLTKNATTKVLKELDNEYQLKCGHQKKIMKVIKKMEDEIKKNEKIILDLEEEFNIQKDKNKKLKEQERIEKERIEKERIEKERIESERKEKERLEIERKERERIEEERIEKERLEKERKEKERKERDKLKKLEKESIKKEKLERANEEIRKQMKLKI